MGILRSPGIRKRFLSVCAALALCVPLVLLAQMNKGKPPRLCPTVTADAEFLDFEKAGILSGNESSIYGDKKYYGLEDTLVCLLKDQDHDFILSTMGGTSYERASGIDRKITLNFSANDQDLSLLPFAPPIQVVDALIRSDEVLADTYYTNEPKRLILWFSVGRNNYRLVFDGLDESEWVLVTQTGVSPNRTWTIVSAGTETARLESDHRGKRFTIGHFIMPFQITVYETMKPPTCL